MWNFEHKGWRWDKLRTLGNSKLVQLTFLIPVLGYFLIFGEQFNDYLKLSFDADVSYWRIYFLYFGFCFLALGSLVFTLKCPDEIRLHGADFEYVDREKDILSEERIGKMREALMVHDFNERVRDKGWPEFLDALKFDPYGPDAKALEEAELRRRENSKIAAIKVRDPIFHLEIAELMSRFFAYQSVQHSTYRLMATVFYGFGIALVLVPTVLVFGEVSVEAWSTFSNFIAEIFTENP